jgi:ABC-type transporter MlaC component
MKKTLVIIFLAVAAFSVGCKQSAESPAEMNVQAAADKVETKTKDAAQATKELTQARKEYAYAQKAEFVTEKKAQLAELNRELIVLSNKVETSSEARSTARPIGKVEHPTR